MNTISSPEREVNNHTESQECISGLPSFLWSRFPLTRNKPVGGHAPTVISSKGCECAVRKGDVGVLKFYDIIGGRRGYPQIRITVNRSRKNLSETFHPFPASLSHSPGNLPGGSVQLR
ncbi:hypothetical protein OUZ56_009244 [Daphnia magna]|uniref:Uncharacterized protein n=1 Tax=Daphnia magna TaxID=35525 RepID=A0ABR0AFE5_9CRUS|nr:hypothetical protein OUZ56_009244 [Daphnia magna]